MNTKNCPTCGFLLSDGVVVIDRDKWDRLVEILEFWRTTTPTKAQLYEADDIIKEVNTNDKETK